MKTGKIILPGTVLNVDEQKSKIGPGFEYINQKFISTFSGRYFKSKESNTHWIDVNTKRYRPCLGETVIGIVAKMDADYYQIDIATSKYAILNKLDFEGATKKCRPILKRGNVVYATITMLLDHVQPEIKCIHGNGKTYGLGPLSSDGVMTRVSIQLSRILLESSNNVLEKIGSICSFESAIGFNGRVWIKAENFKISQYILMFIKSLDQKSYFENFNKNKQFICTVSDDIVKNLQSEIEKMSIVN